MAFVASEVPAIVMILETEVVVHGDSELVVCVGHSVVVAIRAVHIGNRRPG